MMPDHVYKDVALALRTTLKVGGNAEWYIEATDEAMIREAARFAQQHKKPLTILGGGSNVLVSDEGIAGVVLHIRTKDISYNNAGDSLSVTASAGVVFDELVCELVEKNIWGLENLSHIPGSVGAAPIQNIGAYGVEVSDCIASVHVYDIVEDAYVVLKNRECMFQYRDSRFKTKEGKRYIVTAVTFHLSYTPKPILTYKDIKEYFSETKAPTLKEIRDAVIEIRSRKFPDWHTVGTAGSFFKNPIISQEKYESLRARYPELPGYPEEDTRVKVSLGYILDKILHLKGFKEGAVGLSDRQALVLMNSGGATARDIHTFASDIAQRVKDATGISIEWEVTRLGED